MDCPSQDYDEKAKNTHCCSVSSLMFFWIWCFFALLNRPDLLCHVCLQLVMGWKWWGRLSFFFFFCSYISNRNKQRILKENIPYYVMNWCTIIVGTKQVHVITSWGTSHSNSIPPMVVIIASWRYGYYNVMGVFIASLLTFNLTNFIYIELS